MLVAGTEVVAAEQPAKIIAVAATVAKPANFLIMFFFIVSSHFLNMDCKISMITAISMLR